MSTYSVSEAKNGLPSLIDRAIEGEEVLITRRGQVVAELRPARAGSPSPAGRAAAFARLKAAREAQPSIGVDSLDILRELKEERPW